MNGPKTCTQMLKIVENVVLVSGILLLTCLNVIILGPLPTLKFPNTLPGTNMDAHDTSAPVTTAISRRSLRSQKIAFVIIQVGTSQA